MSMAQRQQFATQIHVTLTVNDSRGINLRKCAPYCAKCRSGASALKQNVFGTFVDQVKRLLALSYGQFEAIHHKTHRKKNTMTGLERAWGFQEIEAPRFQDNRHMKAVRLSTLRTGRLYPPGNIPGTHFF